MEGEQVGAISCSGR